MGREFQSLEDFRTELNSAVERAITVKMVDNLKTAIQESEDSRVYSYQPKTWWAKQTRRMEDGGIKDRKNMYATYDFGSLQEKTVEMEIRVGWQWVYPVKRFHHPYGKLKGGPNPTGDLVEAIETSGIYGVRRPFMQEAGEDYIKNQAETDLITSLAEDGFDN